MSDTAKGGCHASDRVAVGPDVPCAATLKVSLSNAAALDAAAGETVAEMLARRLPISPALRSKISTVVDEAVLNAIIHGHLAVPNDSRASFAGILDFEQVLAHQLSDPSAIDKKCEIRVRWNPACIFVSVSDQGAGFVPVGQDATQPWGRGMQIMTAFSSRCRWTKGGRRVVIRFARCAA